MTVAMRPLVAAASLLKLSDVVAFSVFHHTRYRQRQRQRHCRSFSAIWPSHQHPLLPLPAPNADDGDDCDDASIAITNGKLLSPADIQNVLLASKINKVAFIRHGNTASAPVDFDRTLTQLGRAQSRAAGASFGIQELYPFYQAGALCSLAPRCAETAELFLDSSMQELTTDDTKDEECSPPPIKLYSELYDGTMQPEGSRLFRSIGYAPLRKYLMNKNKADTDAAKTVLGGYAHVSLNVILDILKAKDKNQEEISFTTETNTAGETLLFFAHAIYLPSAALTFAAAVGCSSSSSRSSSNRTGGTDGDVDLILDTNTNEAEGYCVNIDTKCVSLLRRPENVIKDI